MRKNSSFYSILVSLVFGVMMVVIPGVGWGQSTIFTESMGTVVSITTIAAHEAANGFDNDSYTMTSGGATNPGDIRATSVSSGYTGASGSANIWLTSTNAAYGFAIEGIDGSTYTNLTVQFGYRKESVSALPTLALDYWNGTAYVNVPFTFNEAANASVAWYLSPVINLPSGAQISTLRLRWVKTGSVAARIDDVILKGSLPAPTITLSSPSQVSVGNINQGATNQSLSHFQAAVTTSNATLNSLAFTTAGTYAASDLANFKLYYATTDDFGAASSISTISISLETGSHTFSSLTQAINSGVTGYFWITCDVSAVATPANAINIAVNPVLTFASGTPTGTIAAGGTQTIQALVPIIVISSPSPAVGTANISQNTTNNVIYRFDNAVTVVNATMSGLQITTAGTYAAADLTNLKVWYSSDATFSAGSDALLSTKTTSLGAGTQVFSSWTNQVISSGSTGYIFITTDIPCTAISGNTISVNAVTTSDVTFLSGNKSGATSAGGTQTITLATPSNVTSPGASVANSQSVLTWTNPADCYSEIMIVAKASTSVTGTPTGDGTSYTADLVFGTGTGFGGGYVVYKGSASSQTVTGLAMGTLYYYKLFTRNGTNWTTGTEVSATTIKAEPTNHPTVFQATTGTPSYSAIIVSWTDAAVGTLPDGYLIKASSVSYDNILAPMDGTPEDNGTLVKNVAQGIQTTSFTGLSSNTAYFFKIFPYTNSGGNINYKTNETVPSSSASTAVAPVIINGWQFGSPESTGIESTYNSTTNDSHVTVSTLSRGTGIAATALARGFSSNNWDVSGTKASAVTNNEYYQFSIITLNGYKVSLSTIDATLRRTSAGPNAYIWMFSIDGSVFNEIGSDVSFTSTAEGVAQTQIVLSGISALQNVTDATTITFRLYAWGATATSGTFAIARYGTGVTTNCLAIGGTVNLYSSTYSGTGSWSTSGNWNNGIPSASINAIIDGSTILDANSEINSLTVNAGRSLTINPTQSLTVNGSLINNAGITGLIIKSDATGTGSLLHTSASVPATVERYFTGSPEAWHLISSPVNTQEISGGFTPAGSYPDGTGYDFYMWQESSMTWVNKKNTGTSPTWLQANGSNNFVVGRGYMAAYQASNPVKTFTGNLNNGIIYIPLSNTSTGTYTRTNLVGNPYPSSLDWKSAAGLDKGDLEPATGGGYNIYIYNQTANNYGVYNDVAVSDEGTNSVTRNIAPMQGFLVNAKTGTLGSGLGFDNDARVHSVQGWLKSEEPSSLRLTVTAPQNAGSDEVMFDFGHASNTGGAEKWFSLVNTAPSLYAVKDNVKYSIDFLSSVDNNSTIPVDFKAGVDGSYTMKATFSQNFGFVTLEDLSTGIRTDLRNNPVYAFNASTSDSPGRFLLHFAGVGISDPSGVVHPVSVYASGNTLVVTGKNGEPVRGELFVYTMMGQLLLNQQLSGSNPERISLDAAAGYYLVKVVCSDQVFSGKVFVR